MYKTAYEKMLAREVAGRMHKQALWYPTYNRHYFIGPKKELKDQRDSFLGETYGEMIDIMNKQVKKREEELAKWNKLMRGLPGYDVSYEKHQATGDRPNRTFSHSSDPYKQGPAFMPTSVQGYGRPYTGVYSPYRPAPAFYPPLY